MPFALPVISLGMKVGIFAGVIGALVIAWKVHIHSVEAQGAAKAVAKIERANVEVVKKASRAADRSRDPSVRGVVDPSTRWD